MSDSTGHRPSASTFATTRWTLILEARGDTPESKAALGELCAAYWGPVFRFIWRDGRTEDDARELTQEFFARLLARGGLHNVEQGRGRFRSFLLGAVRHFLADMRDRERAAKRGGGREVVSLDDRSAEEESDRATPADPNSPLPDAWFDREWASHLVNRAVDALAQEQTAEDRRHAFAVLKPWLMGEVAGLSQGEAARQLGWTENAVRVAVHRLRKRFRELVKVEIGQTVETSEDVSDELRYLLSAWDRARAN